MALYRVPCEDCSAPLNPTAAGTWQRAEGWVEARRQGGANQLALAERQSRFLCNACMAVRRTGAALAPEQGGLFG